MRRYISIIVALVLVQSCTAQKVSYLQKVVSDLASDEYKGRKVGTLENQQTAEYIAAEFKKIGLEPCLGDSYLVAFDYQDKTEYNVCGLQKGTTDEIVAFGAHFDHVGMDDEGEDKIFNGADDNASGVGMFLSLADQFKKDKLSKTLMFIGFNAEEVGLVGAARLAENPEFDTHLKNMNTLFVFEMLGMKSRFGANKVYMTGSDRSDLIELVNQYAKLNFEVVEDPYKKYQLFYRSDNAPFVKKGIVAHALSTVDMETATHYHQKNDDIKVIDFENMNQLSNSMYETFKSYIQSNAQPKLND